MFECELPFDHKTLHLELEDKNFAGVMEGHQNEFKTTKSQEELVEESLANPYGSPSLEELCAGKSVICLPRQCLMDAVKALILLDFLGINQ